MVPVARCRRAGDDRIAEDCDLAGSPRCSRMAEDDKTVAVLRDRHRYRKRSSTYSVSTVSGPALVPSTCEQVQVGAPRGGHSAGSGHDCSIRSAADSVPHARSGRATSASRAILGCASK
jgi:hypothetical protein